MRKKDRQDEGGRIWRQPNERYLTSRTDIILATKQIELIQCWSCRLGQREAAIWASFWAPNLHHHPLLPPSWHFLHLPSWQRRCLLVFLPSFLVVLPSQEALETKTVGSNEIQILLFACYSLSCTNCTRTMKRWNLLSISRDCTTGSCCGHHCHRDRCYSESRVCSF